jgi:ribosomal protein S18 acetylase RimI-like enzyme
LAVVRELRAGDTAEVLELLREHALRNVFLEHTVRAGLLGRVPGFFGWEAGGRLQAVLMVGPTGGVSLDVHTSEAFAPLAEHVSGLAVRPRHIIGHEEVTVPFWEAYAPYADELIWSRREPVYVLGRDGLSSMVRVQVERAGERDLSEIVANSRRQHLEDLKEDRFAVDPEGFRRRHRLDLRERRWWVLREGGRIGFQVHAGPENDRTVQVGGVFTPADLRKRGLATRGMQAVAEQLLKRHPAVSLFCDEDNDPARRLYERLGFVTEFHYRSYLLQPPAASARPAEYA